MPDAPIWLILLAAVGVVAIATVGMALFTSVGDAPPRAGATARPAVETEEFLLGLAGTLNSPLQRGGTARLLNDGDQYFAAMLQAMRDARHSINLMVYIWEEGEVSREFFRVLRERARAGVEVRVMVDALGGMLAPDDDIRGLRADGGHWEWFHPARFGQLTRFHKRNHRRAVVVDGGVAFTGGAAIGDKWSGHAQDPQHWRDCMVEARGCIATNLQSAFTQLWAQVTGEMLVGPRFYLADEAASAAENGTGEPISHHVNMISSPSDEAQPLRHAFWLSFHAARRSIYITNPYFVPDDVVRAVLQERAREGVDVRVLVPNEHTDVPLIRWASHHYYDRLLAAGVRIYEYQPTMIHQKLAVIDGAWSMVGSANLDVRSKELNQENVLGILDRGFARQVEEAFFRDLEHAHEIHLRAWRDRPRWRRIPERLSSLFEEQF